ncbi:hypothetical protein RclHR1_09960009 [Rhizophagus clarus]|uniref:Uncharacterized protein n=1 Tax=Rhizophagus clarus TaxID=94130 RepID=A0A2Z6SI15_9GLOM|nr:hypothetical protein RclHR1_01550031 [Rhizophagus clarus]GBB97377.1 hypothetical protein RclHR1_02980016 [Rhizophagus clarus]GBC09932.1 hypothetical protein RclHR1_09210001 [Rhizophagus clarus]GBC10858.1 hypothetical protein RclHR1_09960009 [Rhizophagus clarus]
MKVPRKNKISSSVVYTKPTKEQKEYYKQKSVVENTHLSTNNWLKKFEKYRKTIGLAGNCENITNLKDLEEQISDYVTVMKQQNGEEYSTSSIINAMHALNRHLNMYSPLRPVDLLDQKQFPDLHLILDGKLKELAELGKGVKNGSSPLTIEECQQILQSPILTQETPSGLLKRIFFYNALFLGLRGGEHYKLKFNHFQKRYDGGYDVNITRSKTKQGGIEDPNNGSGDKLRIPGHPSIIADYDLFFTKRPINAKENFYLQEITDEDVYIYQGKWYLKNQIGKLRLQGFLHNLAVECGISAEGRKITNHSGRKSLVSLLKELNFTDIEVMSVSRHKSISGLKSYERSSEKLQNVSLNGLVEAIFMPGTISNFYYTKVID